MAIVQSTQPRVRLAEVIASLSLTTDLATGQALEHGLRRALLAVWLGEDLGLSDGELSNVYYVALLGAVGCTIEGAALSAYFKDEIAFGEQLVLVDRTRPIKVATFFFGKIGEGDPPPRRARKVVSAALAGPTESQIICRDVAMQVGEMLDLGPAIREALGQCHEQWDGRFPGGPRRLKGEEISLPARIFILAHDVEIFNRVGGVEAAVAIARQRAGRIYDPELAERFCAAAESHLRRLQSEVIWEAVLAAEPEPVRLLSPQDLDGMTETIANFVDMRSQYTLRHSPRVASLSETAARKLGLSGTEAIAVRQAGLLHDLGRAGVPVVMWNKTVPLTGAEWERMQSHPALTELVLARSRALGPLGTLSGLHHERLDGSGYRGVRASFLPVAARILAVADAYQSKIEPRPHRQALEADEAAQSIRYQGQQGRLDGDVVDAVLEAAGQSLPHRKRQYPADLTEREVEVLQLAVRGLSNREMAETLAVSPKTVGHHIEHIYQKIGVSTRVGATLFALQHGLVEDSS